MKEQDRVQKILGSFSEAKRHRLNYDLRWRVIADYVIPNRGWFLIKPMEGFSKSRDIYNSTAILANQNLASTLHGTLTNRGSNWLNLRTKNNFVDTPNSKLFLDNATNKMLDIFNSPTSEFPLNNHEFLLSLTSLGTSAMFIEDDMKGGIHFMTFHMSQIYIGVNQWDKIDTVFREFEFTGRQCNLMWNKGQMSPQLQQRCDANPDGKITLLHHVYPRDEDDVNLLPWTSCYVDPGDMQIIEEKGYHEMPYVIGRFSKLSGEMYGRSPAWDVLADIQMVNQIDKEGLKTLMLQSSPPILMADDGVIPPTQLAPNVIINGGISMDGTRLIDTLPIGGNINNLIVSIERAENRIKKAFFENLLIYRDGPQITATEAMQMKDESLMLLSPQIGRIESEYLNKVIDRVFGILIRQSPSSKLYLGPIPPELKGQELEVEYLSPLSKISKMDKVNAITKFGTVLGPLAQVYPQSFDWLNADRMAQAIADDIGVPRNILSTQDEVDAKRAAQQKQQQMQQNLQMAQVAQNLTTQTGQKPNVQ